MVRIKKRCLTARANCLVASKRSRPSRDRPCMKDHATLAFGKYCMFKTSLSSQFYPAERPRRYPCARREQQTYVLTLRSVVTLFVEVAKPVLLLLR